MRHLTPGALFLETIYGRALRTDATAMETADRPASDAAQGTVPSRERSATKAALGVDMLLDVFDGDGVAVTELLNSALESIELDLVRIERAAPIADFTGVLEAAHRMKGTSGSIESRRVAAVSTAIECAARERHSVEPDVLHEVRQAVEVLRVEIRAANEHIDARPH